MTATQAAFRARTTHSIALLVAAVLFAGSVNALTLQGKPVAPIIAQAAHDFAPNGWPEAQFRKALAGIIWIESRNCAQRIGDHGRALGCGQLHRAAIVQVLGAPVPYWLAMMNDSFNIRVSAMYLAYCYRCTGSAARAVGCFNAGPAGRNAEYVALVEAHR